MKFKSKYKIIKIRQEHQLLIDEALEAARYRFYRNEEPPPKDLLLTVIAVNFLINDGMLRSVKAGLKALSKRRKET